MNWKNTFWKTVLHLKTQYFALQDYSDMFGRNALDSLAHNIGIVIFDNIRNIDQSLIIWRSSTQWIGGLYFLFSMPLSLMLIIEMV